MAFIADWFAAPSAIGAMLSRLEYPYSGFAVSSEAHGFPAGHQCACETMKAL
ncbi:hypothetical protein [Paenarthrobacter aurescens]|uniref:hypothetical protein n=1 Tax=Paenarthrobacter aurescens TaxID=43663 RepID=UPI0014774B91|nr:hypothetical protein [Paenarthrobacter aurescens]MDO6141690.1 hypothetical protein [Paenarthrobacter aurescens]MDO6149453.1 hypothetical protein [Paenarthrobacter aurescens]MDO6156739.1 hypothetical protein [Paenarthrobacter aurescens]MDO6160725.1 hypothetical protein [Paenarthrobacter aurescens]